MQPDYTLTDAHGKRIFVEVKPDYSQGKLAEDLEKYAKHKQVRKEATTVILTSFQKTIVCILGKASGCEKAEFSVEEYINRFEDLWNRIEFFMMKSICFANKSNDSNDSPNSNLLILDLLYDRLNFMLSVV